MAVSPPAAPNAGRTVPAVQRPGSSADRACAVIPPRPSRGHAKPACARTIPLGGHIRMSNFSRRPRRSRLRTAAIALGAAALLALSATAVLAHDPLATANAYVPANGSVVEWRPAGDHPRQFPGHVPPGRQRRGPERPRRAGARRRGRRPRRNRRAEPQQRQATGDHHQEPHHGRQVHGHLDHHGLRRPRGLERRERRVGGGLAAGVYRAHEATTTTSSSNTVIATTVGVIIVILIAAGAVLFWFRRRRDNMSQESDS